MQNYSNHKRYNKPFHFVFMPIIFGCIIYIGIILFENPTQTNTLLLIAFVAIGIFAFFSRTFALKAQDRAIRAEESLRYYILTGKPLPKELRFRQILALRFAEDTEFAQLVERCLFDKLSSDEIKKAIIDWRADNNRV